MFTTNFQHIVTDFDQWQNPPFVELQVFLNHKNKFFNLIFDNSISICLSSLPINLTFVESDEINLAAIV
jgi:hypothetical protein